MILNWSYIITCVFSFLWGVLLALLIYFTVKKNNPLIVVLESDAMKYKFNKDWHYIKYKGICYKMKKIQCGAK
jgi:hypothetical protein